MRNCYPETAMITYRIDQVEEIAAKLWSLHDVCKIFTFTGSLGAGKTTLVRAILKESGVKELITSPTFTYVNTYINTQGFVLYHFDCYRITSVDAFLQAGFDEYLYQPNSWCFIEWPEIIMPLIDHAACHSNLEYESGEQRLLTYNVI